MDVFDLMLELSRDGFDCAQILLSLALELDGKSDPDLVRAMGGLSSGIAGGGDVCGALAGGACLLSYFAGRGEPDELPHPKLEEMYASLREWFDGYTAGYGGASCRCILAGDPRNRIQRCPMVVQSVFEKCFDLLERNGVL